MWIRAIRMEQVVIVAHDTSRRAHFLVGGQGKAKEEVALEFDGIHTYCLFNQALTYYNSLMR